MNHKGGCHHFKSWKNPVLHLALNHPSVKISLWCSFQPHPELVFNREHLLMCNSSGGRLGSSLPPCYQIGAKHSRSKLQQRSPRSPPFSSPGNGLLAAMGLGCRLCACGFHGFGSRGSAQRRYLQDRGWPQEKRPGNSSDVQQHLPVSLAPEKSRKELSTRKLLCPEQSKCSECGQPQQGAMETPAGQQAAFAGKSQWGAPFLWRCRFACAT